MNDERSQSARSFARIDVVQAVGAVVVAWLLAQLAGKVVADLLLASPALQLPGGKDVHGLRPGVVVPAMFASQLAILAVALAMPLLAALPLRRTLGLQSAAPSTFVAAAFGTIMLGPLGDTSMTLFGRFFPDLSLGVVPILHDIAQMFPWFWLWPVFALMPGVAEELLFRGVLQRSLVNPTAAVVVSGGVFALFHFDPVHVVGVLPLGMFLAWVAQRCGTSVTIFAHVANNSMAIFSMQSEALDVGYGTPQELPASWLVASVLGAVLAIRFIARTTSSTAN